VLAGEIYVPHLAPRERVPVASAVRGTVILASLRGIRARGYGDRYMANLDPAFHETLASLTAATWLPLSFAFAHYEACDRLKLDRHVMEEIGAESGRFINETILTVLSRLSREGGLTPWTALTNVNKLSQRTWIGGSFAVWKLGPKEARLEWIQQPVARVPYFRHAFGAFAHGICSMFCRKMYVRDLPIQHTTELAYRLSWV
jgi:hypothetical protein